MTFADFSPIPEKNRLFQTNDGRLCIVVDLLAKGDNSYVIAKDIVSEKQFEWNAVEWNNNIDSILSDTHPFVQEYAKSIKSAKELIQDELDEIQTKRNAGKELKGKCGKFKEFLWTFAGADKDLLRMCPTDHDRITGFGGTIFMEGLLSGLTFGYGAHMLTDSMFISFVLGVICFCMTIFFDGFIINTIYSDGKVTISKRELISSMPRIILGIIIGIVIAAPLQLKIFEGKINDYLLTEHRNSVLTSSAYITNEDKIYALKEEIQNLKKTIQLQDKKYAEELLTNRSGIGPVATELSLRSERAKQMLFESSCELSQLNFKRDSLINIANLFYEEDFSFISRIEALTKISSFHNESKILPIINLLVCLVWIMISITPVITKMMMAGGVYEHLLKREEELTERITRIHIIEFEKKINN